MLPTYITNLDECPGYGVGSNDYNRQDTHIKINLPSRGLLATVQTFVQHVLNPASISLRDGNMIQTNLCIVGCSWLMATLRPITSGRRTTWTSGCQRGVV